MTFINVSIVVSQVVKLKAQDLRLPSRAWKVKLVGEGADDAGGVFDDTMTEMCHELVSGAVSLLIPTPNSVSDTGNNRDRYSHISGICHTGYDEMKDLLDIKTGSKC